jgi:DNA-directed RNA polymerase specialized sigma24 family protein
MPQTDGRRERQGLTQDAFDRLSEWLDDGADSNGQTVSEMHRRLVSYFDRRNRRSAAQLADETLNRVGRALQDTALITVTPPARYCYAVARSVLLEDIRSVLLEDLRRARLVGGGGDRPGSDAASAALPSTPGDLVAIRERRFTCLERCLGQLAPEQRELAVDYYRREQRQENERRLEMADRLGIAMAALSIRACRIRQSLEACVGACRQES